MFGHVAGAGRAELVELAREWLRRSGGLVGVVVPPELAGEGEDESGWVRLSLRGRLVADETWPTWQWYRDFNPPIGLLAARGWDVARSDGDRLTVVPTADNGWFWDEYLSELADLAGLSDCGVA